MMDGIRFHLPAAVEGEDGRPVGDLDEVVARYVAAFDFLIDQFSVPDFEICQPILSAPAPAWLGHVYEGRTIDLATTRRLFADMVQGGGVGCVLVHGLLRLEPSWDYFVHAEFEGDVEEVAVGLRSLGMVVEVSVPLEDEDDDRDFQADPADEAFWGRVREKLASSTGSFALVVERWAHGAYGQGWYFVRMADVDEVKARCRARSTVVACFDVEMYSARNFEIRELIQSTFDGMTEVVVFPAPARFELRSRVFQSGIGVVPDEDFPEGDELGFFKYPEPGGDHFLVAIVPDLDGVVRAVRL